jgi:adhesin transport system outer membrane protein
MIQKTLLNLTLFFFIFFSTQSVFAEDRSLSLSEALTFALSNPSIAGKRKEVQGANEKYNAAKWQRFPSVSISSSQAQRAPNNPSGTAVTSVILEQPIFAGGRIDGNINSAKARLDAADFALQEVEQDIMIKTATAFVTLLKTQSKLEASRESIAEHQRLLGLIERRARSELSPLSEIIVAKARLDQAKTENLQLKTQAINARADLEVLIGHTVSYLKHPNKALDVPENLKVAIDSALAFAPVIKRLRKEADAATSDIDVANSSMYPQLSARSQENFGGILDGNLTYLALTFTPGNGLSSLSLSREALMKKEAAELTIEAAKLDITNKTRTDWNQYKVDQSQIEVLSNLSEMTRGVYESYVRQFEVGKRTWPEVLNARREATQAKYSLAESDWSSFISGIKVQIYTGAINENNLDLMN